MDRRKLDALTRDELLEMARAAAIDGADWLSREELVDTLAAGPSPLRRSLFDRARELFEKAQKVRDLLTRPSRVPPPPAAPVPPGPPPTPRPPTEADATGGFETITMAEVYASQGHLAEAARIAEAMLARDPDNASARQVLDRVRAAESDDGIDDPPAEYGIDTVLLLLVRPDRLLGIWEMTAEGRARAADWLGEPGTPTLRLFTATANGTRVHDEPLDPDRGQRFFDVVPADGRHRLAIGLSSPSGRFAPIAHSEAVASAPATPSDDTRVEWIRVEPATRSTAVAPPVPAAVVQADLRVQGRARRNAYGGDRS